MRLITVFFVITLFFLFQVSPVYALRLTPSYLDLSVQRGERIEKKLVLENDQTEDTNYKLEITDVKFDSQTPQFLTSNEIPPDSIRWWINLASTDIKLKRGEKREIPVTFSIANNASPGGHYGAIMINHILPGEQANNTAIGLAQKMASLIFINVEGQVNRFIQIEKFDSNASVYGSLPIKFNLLVKNNGNTHLQPHGIIQIFDTFTNKYIEQLSVNDDFQYLFPQTQKLFEVEWTDPNPLGSIWRYFGRYKAVLELKADNTPSVKSEVVFWVLPGKIITIVSILILMVVLSLAIYTRLLIKNIQNARNKSLHKGGYG